MINVEIKSNIKFPEFTFIDDLVYIAERIFIPYIEDNIDKGVALDGGGFPPNSEKTIKRKGHARVLIGLERKLRRAFMFKKGKDYVSIKITPDRKDVAYILQEEGIRTNHGRQYYNFFGINSKMEGIAVNYMKKRIGEQIDSSKK